MTTNKLQFIRVLGGLALILLAACDRIEPPVAAEPTPITAPEGVLRSREAVLAFLRDGAAECVPAKQAKWTVEREAEAPQGFDVYRFLSSGCTMTITVPQSSEVTRYHVALGDGPTGFCWQAVVDAQGQVVLTGNEAQTDATLGNPALAYCQEHGYTYQVITSVGGRLCGMCVFNDNRACNAWAYFHGACTPENAAPLEQ